MRRDCEGERTGPKDRTIARGEGALHRGRGPADDRRRIVVTAGARDNGGVGDTGGQLVEAAGAAGLNGRVPSCGGPLGLMERSSHAWGEVKGR